MSSQLNQSNISGSKSMKYGAASVGGSYKNLPKVVINVPNSRSANNLSGDNSRNIKSNLSGEQKQFVTANSRSSIGGMSRPMSKLDGNASSQGFQSALNFEISPNKNNRLEINQQSPI